MPDQQCRFGNGAGSSTVAMARLGVNGIGIDIDETYCQSAKARVLAEKERVVETDTADNQLSVYQEETETTLTTLPKLEVDQGFVPMSEPMRQPKQAG